MWSSDIFVLLKLRINKINVDSLFYFKIFSNFFRTFTTISIFFNAHAEGVEHAEGLEHAEVV